MVMAFSTERGFDELIVNGVSYSGSSGPSGVSVWASTSIIWVSDRSETRSGFEICWSGLRVPTLTHWILPACCPNAVP